MAWFVADQYVFYRREVADAGTDDFDDLAVVFAPVGENLLGYGRAGEGQVLLQQLFDHHFVARVHVFKLDQLHVAAG